MKYSAWSRITIPKIRSSLIVGTKCTIYAVTRDRNIETAGILCET